MKHLNRSLLVIILALLCLTGCEQIKNLTRTPQEKWYVKATAFDLGVQEATVARQQGRIDDTLYKKIDPFVQNGQTLLADSKKKAFGHPPVDDTVSLDTLDAILKTIAQYLKENK